MSENPIYIGDGVYAYFDGFGIELRLERHDAQCTVYLEPNVMQALSDFFNRAPGTQEVDK